MSSRLPDERLDALLKSDFSVSSDALASMRAALLKRPEMLHKPSWKRDALLLWTACFGTVLLVGAVLLLTQNVTFDIVMARSRTVLTLMGISCLASVSALAPRRHWARIVALVGAVGSAGLLVWSRSQDIAFPPTQPEWVCSLSHIGAAIPPLVVALIWLRRMHTAVLRPLVAGVAVGTTGAMLGEIGCAQSFTHVMLFHVSVWAVVAGLSVFLSSRLKATSYVP